MSRRDCYCFLAGVCCALLILAGVQPRSIAGGRLADAVTASPQAQSPQAQVAQAAMAAGSIEEVTSRLAARLAVSGGTDQDWQLLEQSYTFLGRAADASAARFHQVHSNGGAIAAAGASPAAAPGAAGQAALRPVSSAELAAVARSFDTTTRSGATP